mmetsp:Transcript_32327/g.102805  ORF Transcript_32327/g.102805 Transcript_32327/m.102805 type:complete len:214 (-) Transcript_32327:148-789(-)
MAALLLVGGMLSTMLCQHSACCSPPGRKEQAGSPKCLPSGGTSLADAPSLVAGRSAARPPTRAAGREGRRADAVGRMGALAVTRRDMLHTCFFLITCLPAQKPNKGTQGTCAILKRERSQSRERNGNLFTFLIFREEQQKGHHQGPEWASLCASREKKISQRPRAARACRALRSSRWGGQQRPGTTNVHMCRTQQSVSQAQGIESGGPSRRTI